MQHITIKQAVKGTVLVTSPGQVQPSSVADLVDFAGVALWLAASAWVHAEWRVEPSFRGPTGGGGVASGRNVGNTDRSVAENF